MSSFRKVIVPGSDRSGKIDRYKLYSVREEDET